MAMVEIGDRERQESKNVKKKSCFHFHMLQKGVSVLQSKRKWQGKNQVKQAAEIPTKQAPKICIQQSGRSLAAYLLHPFTR